MDDYTWAFVSALSFPRKSQEQLGHNLASQVLNDVAEAYESQRSVVCMDFASLFVKLFVTYDRSRHLTLPRRAFKALPKKMHMRVLRFFHARYTYHAIWNPNEGSSFTIVVQ